MGDAVTELLARCAIVINAHEFDLDDAAIVAAALATGRAATDAGDACLHLDWRLPVDLLFDSIQLVLLNDEPRTARRTPVRQDTKTCLPQLFSTYGSTFHRIRHQPIRPSPAVYQRRNEGGNGSWTPSRVFHVAGASCRGRPVPQGSSRRLHAFHELILLALPLSGEWDGVPTGNRSLFYARLVA